MLLDFDNNLLYMMLCYVGIHSMSLKVVCKRFMICMRRPKYIVIDGHMEKRMLEMLKYVDLEYVMHICIMNVDFESQIFIHKYVFKNVVEIKFVNCCSDSCQKILNAFCEKLEVVSFVDCKVDGCDMNLDKFGELRLVKFRRCDVGNDVSRNMMVNFAKSLGNINGWKSMDIVNSVWGVGDFDGGIYFDGEFDVNNCVCVRNVVVEVSGLYKKEMVNRKMKEFGDTGYVTELIMWYYNYLDFVGMMSGLIRLDIFCCR